MERQLPQPIDLVGNLLKNLGAIATMDVEGIEALVLDNNAALQHRRVRNAIVDRVQRRGDEGCDFPPFTSAEIRSLMEVIAHLIPEILLHSLDRVLNERMQEESGAVIVTSSDMAEDDTDVFEMYDIEMGKDGKHDFKMYDIEMGKDGKHDFEIYEIEMGKDDSGDYKMADIVYMDEVCSPSDSEEDVEMEDAAEEIITHAIADSDFDDEEYFDANDFNIQEDDEEFDLKAPGTVEDIDNPNFRPSTSSYDALSSSTSQAAHISHSHVAHSSNFTTVHPPTTSNPNTTSPSNTASNTNSHVDSSSTFTSGPPPAASHHNTALIAPANSGPSNVHAVSGPSSPSASSSGGSTIYDINRTEPESPGLHVFGRPSHINAASNGSSHVGPSLPSTVVTAPTALQPNPPSPSASNPAAGPSSTNTTTNPSSSGSAGGPSTIDATSNEESGQGALMQMVDRLSGRKLTKKQRQAELSQIEGWEPADIIALLGMTMETIGNSFRSEIMSCLQGRVIPQLYETIRMLLENGGIKISDHDGKQITVIRITMNPAHKDNASYLDWRAWNLSFYAHYMAQVQASLDILTRYLQQQFRAGDSSTGIRIGAVLYPRRLLMKEFEDKIKMYSERLVACAPTLQSLHDAYRAWRESSGLATPEVPTFTIDENLALAQYHVLSLFDIVRQAQVLTRAVPSRTWTDDINTRAVTDMQRRIRQSGGDGDVAFWVSVLNSVLFRAMPPTSTTNNGNAPKVRQAKKKAPPAPAPAPAPLPAPAPTSTPSSKAWDIPDIPDVTNVRGKYRGEAHYRGTPPAGVCDHQWKLAFKALKDRLRKSSGLSVETIHKLEMLGWIYQVCLVRLGVRPRDNCKCDECKK